MGCGGTRNAGKGCAQFPRLAFKRIAEPFNDTEKDAMFRGAAADFYRLAE